MDRKYGIIDMTGAVMVREDFGTSSAAFHDFGPMQVHAAATCCPHCEASANEGPFRWDDTPPQVTTPLIAVLIVSSASTWCPLCAIASITVCSVLRQPRRLPRRAIPTSKRYGPLRLRRRRGGGGSHR